MTLEQQVADLVTATNHLTQTVTDQLGLIQHAVTQAQSDVTTFIQSGAASFPVGPNLLEDTKKFTGCCQGQLGTIMPWDQGGLGGAYGGLFYNGAAGTLEIEVVDVADDSRLSALGLLPLGELELLSRPYPNPWGLAHWGQDHHIAIFDLTLTTPPIANPDHLEGLSFSLTHGTASQPYTSWHIGQFATQTSVFLNVLAASGDLIFEFIVSRTWASQAVGAAQVGQGWKHYHGARPGLGGHNTSYFRTPGLQTGHLKVALALPYSGFGNHQGLPLWTGSLGDWATGDHL